MSRTRKRWLIGSVVAAALLIIAVLVAASIAARRFEPFIRQQALEYMERRFQARVELASLKIKMPKMSPVRLLLDRGRGATAGVEGEGISMSYRDAPDLPPLFSIKRFSFDVDLGTLFDQTKSVKRVTLEGMRIHIPPKGERRQMGAAEPADPSQGPPHEVILEEVRITGAELIVLPKDRKKNPLEFAIHSLTLRNAGRGKPMSYEAALTNPKPPGRIDAKGSFGPWVSGEPGDTPLQGAYIFAKADLGVFSGIAGILESTGGFEGTLSSLTARGTATVPDFRLKMSNNRVPLTTHFEVAVDGTNGNTVLKPVRAKLGSTHFTTSGAVIKHEGEQRRTIDLDVLMPNGDLRDVLRLAMKGPSFMEGRLYLKTKIAIPPLSGKVREKIMLDGTFRVADGRFLKSKIQDQLDQLSRRGQGDPKNEGIDEVVSGMKGAFRLENEVLNFRSLSFGVPGAAVDLAGSYKMDADALDFLGTLKLNARVSQTMTGWKRWALKPVDPFFAKEGAGTFLRVAVTGSSREPQFGLARSRKKAEDGKAAKK